MKKRYIISHSALPAPLNISAIVAYALLLDRLNAPGWAFGAFITLMVILAVAVYWRARNCIKVDPFEPPAEGAEGTGDDGKTRWQRRMDEIRDRQK